MSGRAHSRICANDPITLGLTSPLFVNFLGDKGFENLGRDRGEKSVLTRSPETGEEIRVPVEVWDQIDQARALRLPDL
jgi:hypothetical protein